LSKKGATENETITAPAGAGMRLHRPEGVSVSRSLLGLVIALAGALFLVLSVFADPIGIGVNEGYAFGWKQLLGTVAGIALVVTGYLVWRAAKAPSASRP
jgi:uncharacterized protein YfiM (DUF2279 family)